MLNKLNPFKKIIKSPKDIQILKIILIVAIFAAIPLAVIVTQEQKDLRQRASTSPDIPTASSTPITLEIYPANATIKMGENLNLSILFHPKSNKISEINFTLSFNKNLFELVNFTSSLTFSKNKLKTVIDNKTGYFQFNSGGLSTTNINNLNIPVEIGQLVFKAKSLGTTNIGFTNIQVEGIEQNQILRSNNNSIGKYIINTAPSGIPLQ